jgi:hypothetical protein
MQCRVRREDLYEPASDDAVNRDEQVENELRAKLNEQLSGLLGFDFLSDEQTIVPQTQHLEKVKDPGEATEPAAPQEPEELTYEFRLFRNEEPTHTVVIEQDDDHADGPRELAFVVPKRPISYYIAGEPEPDALERIRSSAVSAEYIMEDAKRRRWGLEKPWKVTSITIKAAHPPGSQLASRACDATEGKRKRPGKKKRVILRTRDRAVKKKDEAAKRLLVDKEEHLKEKKKRLNREKKLKRRAKEREKKSTGEDIMADE